jgi:hypothetical protein
MAAVVEVRVAAQERNLNPWEIRTLEQQCACLVSLGKIAELEELLETFPHTCVRYHLALAYALQNQIDQAVEQLRPALKQQPDYPNLRGLAFQVGVRQADLKLKQQDWNAISSAVALALEAGAPSPEAARELLRFKSALPVSHIKAGTRQGAAEIWERELKDQPGNRALIHNLAILYYWSALQAEANGGAEANRLWFAAIAYWNLIVNTSEFWSAWKAELEQRWGTAVQDSDLQPARDTLLNERLTKLFQNQASSYKEKNRVEDAERHEEYLTAVLLEKKSAEAWKPFSAKPAAGGFLYYQRLGALTEILAQIDRLPQADAQREKLKLYFSPGGLGSILTLIEERRLPDKALERLARLPDNLRSGPDARYLRVLALYESAKEFEKRNAPTDALRQVEMAWTEAQTQPAGALLAPLKESIAELLASAAKQEAARLMKENQLDNGIGLLERLYGLSKHAGIREYLCILYHDRGQEKIGQKLWAEGRAAFQKALDLDKNYVRAKQSMCRAYNNEAMEIADKELALTMLQKAIEYDPDNPVVRDNLTLEFNGKAVRILNAPNTPAKDVVRAIGLLRAAALTIRPDLTDKFMDAFIARAGAGYEEEMKKLPEGTFRLVMNNLQIACQRRAAGR